MGAKLLVYMATMEQVQQHVAEMCACEHEDICEHYTTDDLSDTRTVYGLCRGCGEWVVSTQYATRREPDVRLMTKHEKQVLLS